MREDRRFTQQVVDDVGLKPSRIGSGSQEALHSSRVQGSRCEEPRGSLDLRSQKKTAQGA